MDGVERPVGGTNVLFESIDLLNAAGFDVAPLFGSSTYRYGYAKCAAQGYYLDDLAKLSWASMGKRKKLSSALKKTPFSKRGPRVNVRFEPSDSDVFVLPEYWYPELNTLFENERRILAVQDVFGFMRAFSRDSLTSPILETFDAVFTTSKASRHAVDSFCSVENFPTTLSVERPGLDFQQNKKLQIAYMPRKRAEEVNLLVAALKRRNRLQDVEFVKIEKVSDDELVGILNESLIFLSFSSQEGFGLPPAEALSAGCLTIGYTGVGGNEYFTDDIAFPIPDSDLVNFVDTVESVVAEYRENPARLDALRKKASDRILDKYSAARAHSSFLNAWQKIDDKLVGKNQVS